MSDSVESRPGAAAGRKRPGGPFRHVGARGVAGIFLVAALVFAAVGAAAGNVFYLRLGTEALILSGLAMSVDLLLGYTGLLSLGQAMFFGLGAYASAVLLRDYHTGFWGALVLTELLVVPVAVVAGAIAIRARGVYFILITFGLAQVIGKVIYNTRWLGGSDGMVGIPVVHAPFGIFRLDLGNPVSFFLLVLAIVAVLYVALGYLMNTPFGRTLGAIRSNESRVRYLGFDPWRYKLAAYVLAGMLAAFSGALYPMLRGFVSPELMSFSMSADAVIMVILGGVGTLIGPIYGSVILIGLKTLISGWTEHHQIAIGIIFMLAVIFMPRGLIGLVARRASRVVRPEADQ
ncbi:MAG TPA: branched-chain amino acid ABC transporter permease [Gammaproteobacteria bacterium]|nr:branched-chain amino acid ABC transporter permease [Gammaproteobacteria bacterium]